MLFSQNRLYLFYVRLGSFRTIQGHFGHRWKSKRAPSVDDSKQVFARRHFEKEIERRLRKLKMEVDIMNDLGVTAETTWRSVDKENLSSVSVAASQYLLKNSTKFSDEISAIKSCDILDKNREEEETGRNRVRRNADRARLPLGNFMTVRYSEQPPMPVGWSDRSVETDRAYDRGFHVESDVYKDEYVAGALTDLPTETELDTQTLRPEISSKLSLAGMTSTTVTKAPEEPSGSSTSSVEPSLITLSSETSANTLSSEEFSKTLSSEESSNTLSPENSSSNFTRSDRKAMKMTAPYRIRYGPADAVEEVELLHPIQEPLKVKDLPKNTKRKGADVLDDTGFGEETENQEWKQRYGTSDSSIKPADESHRCVGCGATLHCQDSSLPGFLPATSYLEKQEAGDFSGTSCRRCYLLQRHNFLVNVSVSPIDYERVLGRLRTIENALIILLVDMTDFPSCIYPKLTEFIGRGKPMIVVGTKVDLLPPDTESGYIHHFRRCLRRTVIDMGFGDQMNLLAVLMISAKTGYGIEELVSTVFSKWQERGDIYLIGCTNTGKSTLFNALLQSDLCKIRAVDLVDRATTSLWPGTTLNLLKFPVMNPTVYRMIERNRRLRLVRRYADEEEQHRRSLLEETGDSKYAVLQGIVERTPHFELEDEPGKETENINEDAKIIRPRINFAKKEFAIGRWCFDTPGTVHREQIINYLTLDELIKTVPRSMITPRTYALGRRETLFIAGLSRIDHLAGPSGVLLTIFASDALPIYVEDTDKADEFYKSYIGTAAMAVPYGDKQRLDDFPRLQRRNVKLLGAGHNAACADITVSSAGWVSVTSKREEELQLGVWTPGGVGVFVRETPLHPFMVNERGSRVSGTNAYTGKPIVFPSERDQQRTG